MKYPTWKVSSPTLRVLRPAISYLLNNPTLKGQQLNPTQYMGQQLNPTQ